MLRRLLPALVALAMLLPACGGERRAAAPAAAPPVTGEVTVFAASSLTDAFTELGTAFSAAHPGASVRFSFAASTTLRTQLEQGAKADVFASADQPQMDAARKAGVLNGEDRLFAKNTLVAIYPAGNPGRISSIEDLARPGLKLVLTDKNVPAGAYARAALEKMSTDGRYGAGFGQRVLANLKSEEANVRAVVTKVQLGEADAGIVYASDVTPAVAAAVRSLPLPAPFTTTATYPIAMVNGAPNPTAARAFIQFVRSAAGQAILKRWNFIIDADTGAEVR